MNLSQQARTILVEFFAATARDFGVPARDPSVGQHFAATPSVSQIIYNKIVEDGDPFLKMINALVPVTELKGERVGLSLTNRVASRTDTSGAGERVPKHLDDTAAKLYELFATEFDVALKYAKIDSWAKFRDFAARYMTLVRQAIGNDILQTGWTGTSVAATTNIGTSPLLQDLNIGWLKKIQDFNSGSQYVAGTGPSPIALGSATFPNLDTLVHSARQRLPVYHRNRPDLVALISNNLMASQEETYYADNASKPTEKILVNSGIIMKAYGAMPSIIPPFFPDGKILITPLKNLSIYYQDSSVRRLQKDKPEKNEVQEFNSVNLGYVVEEELMCSYVDNVTIAA